MPLVWQSGTSNLTWPYIVNWWEDESLKKKTTIERSQHGSWRFQFIIRYLFIHPAILYRTKRKFLVRSCPFGDATGYSFWILNLNRTGPSHVPLALKWSSRVRNLFNWPPPWSSRSFEIIKWTYRVFNGIVNIYPLLFLPWHRFRRREYLTWLDLSSQVKLLQGGGATDNSGVPVSSQSTF
jgi:hypothetical protein